MKFSVINSADCPQDVRVLNFAPPGYGWAPAIRCTSDDPDAILSAYVTPIPQTSKECLDESDWDQVRNAALAVYG